MKIHFYALFLFALPLAAQSLSLSCPPPGKFNQAAVCPITFTGAASSLQWKLASSPAVKFTVTTSIPGKSLATANGIYMLMGMNSSGLTGKVATVTIPAHSGTVTLTLSSALGSTSSGHAVPTNTAVTVTVQ